MYVDSDQRFLLSFENRCSSYDIPALYEIRAQPPWLRLYEHCVCDFKLALHTPYPASPTMFPCSMVILGERVYGRTLQARPSGSTAKDEGFTCSVELHRSGDGITMNACIETEEADTALPCVRTTPQVFSKTYCQGGRIH
jgi:hypothetical protein